jgi:hypothetical protein
MLRYIAETMGLSSCAVYTLRGAARLLRNAKRVTHVARPAYIPLMHILPLLAFALWCLTAWAEILEGQVVGVADGDTNHTARWQPAATQDLPPRAVCRKAYAIAFRRLIDS